ncbi:hypothetical protein [Neobacillus bataviensis]|nr:hypothetical protein [Neobacillus bataviensis]
MAKNKNKNKQLNNAMPKADVEFAGESGLAKKALKALNSHNK